MHSERFIILRDNTENGPFSLEEAIAFAIRPKDLVWIEGKSNDWVYATEVKSLQPYVQNAETNFTAQNALNTKEIEKPNVQEGKHIYVSMPPTNIVTIVTNKISISERLERKAQEIYKRVQAYNQQKPVQPIDAPNRFGVLTLNDLRKRYADWRLAKQKEKRYKNMLKVVIPVVALFLIAATYFTWLRAKNEAVILNEDITLYSANAAHKAESDANTEVGYHIPVPPVYDDVFIPEMAIEKEATSVDSFLDSVQRVLALQERNRTTLNIRKGSSKKEKRENTKTAPDTAETKTGSAPEPSEAKDVNSFATLPATVPDNKSVYLSTAYNFNTAKGTLSELDVTVHNNSKQYKTSVSIDVFYYKQKERVISSEVIYFKNIPPQSSMTLPATVNKKATSARCKINKITVINN